MTGFDIGFDLKLVAENDPILTEIAAPFEFNGILDPEKFAKAMVDVMIEAKGVGLAAPQVGMSKRVVCLGNPSIPESIMVLFNPVIVDHGDVEEWDDEGCLSFPFLYIPVTRSQVIRVRFQNQNGETFTHSFQGLTARIIQHEIDHLNGILFTSKVSKMKLDRAMKKREKKIKELGR